MRCSSKTWKGLTASARWDWSLSVIRASWRCGRYDRTRGHSAAGRGIESRPVAAAISAV